MAYPELVSRGVSKSRKLNRLVKIGASKGVTPLIEKNHGRGGGGFPGNQKKPGYATDMSTFTNFILSSFRIPLSFQMVSSSMVAFLALPILALTSSEQVPVLVLMAPRYLKEFTFQRQ